MKHLKFTYQRLLRTGFVMAFLVFMSAFPALAQEIEVTGTVKDEAGQPLPGVNIVVQGTSTGTITDAQGSFQITVSDENATLNFSMVGFQKKSVPLEGRTEISVVLEEQVREVQEVIVTGYSSQEVGSVTGSVSSVSTDELADMPAPDVSETLQGSASGVTTIANHKPGESATVRIRGLGTINNNDPLWVIDGVPTKSGLSQLSPNQIKSITVLKDAASQAIYGARAANGVIIVTTKTGEKGQETQINASVKSGISKNITEYDLLDTKEYGQMLWLRAKNSNGGTLPANYSHTLYGPASEGIDVPEYILPARGQDVDHSKYDRKMIGEDGDDTYLITKANPEGTDWQDVADRQAQMQEYNLNITGGSENTTYAFSGGYMKEEGIYKYTSFERYSLRSNVSSELTDWLEVGEKLGVTFSQNFGMQTNNAENSPIAWAYRMQPIIPVYDVKGNYAGTRVPATGNGRNVLARLDHNKNDRYRDLRSIGNAYAKATIIEGLSFKSLFGFDYRTSDTKNIFLKNPQFSERESSDRLDRENSYTLQWNWANTLEYSKEFGGMHDLNVLLGSESVSNNNRWFGAGRTSYFSRSTDYMFLDGGSSNQTNYGSGSEWKTFSIFGRVNYQLANKYLFEATVRRDGSSRFGENERYGTFPAFSVGWRVSEEDFMSFSDDWLNYLKLRFGWGQSGNDEIGNYNGYTSFASNIVRSYYPITGINSGTPTQGFQSSSFGNPDARWESTTTTNFGVEATVFDFLNVTVDIWQRNTSDMLYPKQVPDVEGQASIPSVNIGKMENTGVDLNLNFNGQAMNNDFTYDVTLNFSHYQNEITKLTGEEGEAIFGSGFRQMTYTRAEEGTAFPEFYGYKVEGIFQSEEEANNHPPAFGEGGVYNEPGHFKFKDVDGNGVINQADRTYIGSPHPDFTSGLNIRLNYKGFNLSTNFYTSYGNDLVNYVRRWIDFNQFDGNRSKRRLYESWGSPYLDDNANAEMPKAEQNDGGSQEPSSYFVEDGSYFRMKSLQIGYNVPQQLLQSLNMKQLRIYGQVTNLFTLIYRNLSGLQDQAKIPG